MEELQPAHLRSTRTFAAGCCPAPLSRRLSCQHLFCRVRLLASLVTQSAPSSPIDESMFVRIVVIGEAVERDYTRVTASADVVAKRALARHSPPCIGKRFPRGAFITFISPLRCGHCCETAPPATGNIPSPG